MFSKKRNIIIIIVFLTAILAGITIYITLRFQSTQDPVDTGVTVTGARFTNACGVGVGSSGSTCNRGCSGTSCSGTWVARFTCNGRVTECGGSGATPIAESSGSTQRVTGQCGTTDQIDVFNKNCRSGGGWNCGSSQDLQDYIVYYNGDCPAPVLTCPSSVQARFRLTVNGRDIGLVKTGTYRVDQVSAIDYTVIRDMQANPPTYFSGTVRLTGPNGLATTNNGSASPRAISSGNIRAGTYTLSAQVNGNMCDGATITLTPAPSISCYRCTSSMTDGNACESQTVQGSSCPSGWTTNSNCAAAVGGSCPVTTPSISCYRCTSSMTDGNACESQTVQGSSCPSGWTTNSNCAAAAGGSCPVTTPSISCYRCTSSMTDGNACESQTVQGSSCPSGWTTNSNCAAAVGGSCPATTPSISCYRCTSSMTDGNACESQTVEGSSCPSGWTTNSNCAEEVGGSCPVQVACGVSCSSDEACGSGHTCDAGICKLDQCLTPGACSDNSCTPVGPTCGDSCATNDECPSDHACDAGICKLNQCLTPGACSDNSCTPVTPVCGSSCSTNDQCPSDHACDAGICKLNQCLTLGACSDNSCTPITTIPDTSIGSDRLSLVIVGTLFMIAGYGTFKLSSRQNLFSSFIRNNPEGYQYSVERRSRKKAESSS